MGWRSARWFGFVLIAASSACGNSSKQPSGDETGAGAGGASGGSAGTPPTAGAGQTGGASGASAGAGAGGMAGSGGTGGGGTGGEGGSAGGAGSAGDGAGTGGVTAELCPEAPTPRLASGTVIELPLELTFGGEPLVFADANPLPGGGTLTPLSVRFYVSDVALLRDGADPLPVDIVTSAATVAPYGVHLFNADDDTSTTLRVLAPMGEYRGITFLWGLAQSCNTRRPETSSAPLSPTSQMTWPHTGFLFFRYEGRTEFTGQAGAGGATAGAAGAATGGAGAGGAGAAGDAGDGAGGANSASMYPAVIHMGGSLFEPLAPAIRVEGALSVPASGSIRKALRVSVDQIFEGALADVDLTGFAGPPGEEVVLGERLRRSLPDLSVFSWGP